MDHETVQRGFEYEKAKLETDLSQQELRRVERFRSTVLSNPGTAIAHWIMSHPGTSLDETALNQLESAVNRIGGYDPTAPWYELSTIFRKFLDNCEPAVVQDLADTLRVMLFSYGHHAEASRVTQLFDLAPIKGSGGQFPT
ncbi:hypothetical protein [Nonomuraea endophytica]|uniref:hypothetical protein n=1 Tax=Nonomuraea endophytica TaxID=714136 RepID=UPI0037C96A3B